MLVLTVIVGVARVLAKVHPPLDMGAGQIIGSAAAYVLAQWLYRRNIGNQDPILVVFDPKQSGSKLVRAQNRVPYSPGS
ncbi:hypothetical protein HJC99_00355 [Candidatus Saccharibacteria bacterium]|nr:hypothetical protein [Candidatus Saccharibacteria bacterium]